MGEEPFRLEEATIEELHRAIQAGRTSCVAVVQHYLSCGAYNGVASLLVIEDGGRACRFRGGPRRRGLAVPDRAGESVAELGREDVLLKIASSYEAASKRRIPPPDFGPL